MLVIFQNNFFCCDVCGFVLMCNFEEIRGLRRAQSIWVQDDKIYWGCFKSQCYESRNIYNYYHVSLRHRFWSFPKSFSLFYRFNFTRPNWEYYQNFKLIISNFSRKLTVLATVLRENENENSRKHYRVQRSLCTVFLYVSWIIYQ